MKLLLIDRDAAFARQLSTELHAQTAGDGRIVQTLHVDEGADLVGRVAFTAMLISLPDAGPEPLSACRRLVSAAPAVPLLALTAEAPDEAALRQFADVVADVLTKGTFTVSQLLQRVRVAVERTKCHAPHAPQAMVRPAFRRVTVGNASSRPREPLAGEGGRLRGAPTVAAERSCEASSLTRPLRVLQVDGDDVYSHLLQSNLSATMKVQCDVQRVSRLTDALECLIQQAFDVILVEPSLPDSEGVETLATLRPYADRAPIVVVTKDKDETQTLESLKHGAQDCHFKGALSAEDLARSIRMAITRHQSASNLDPRRAKSPPDRSRQGAAAEGRPSDRRRHPRYVLTRPLIAVPVLPDGRPAAASLMVGFTMDVSAEGIGFEISGFERLPSQQLILGIEADDGQHHFATVDVQWGVPVPGGLRGGGKLAAAGRDLLCRENLMPRWNHTSHRFETGLSRDVLDQWSQIGICQPQLVDRLLMCPDCKSLPSLRHGCRACGSVRTSSSQLIHHFPCAHVGLASEFAAGGEMVCPKCLQRNLVVGADFEHLAGPYQCLDCHWTDTEFEFVGQCLACELRFPIQQAAHEELIGYHVHRLDPLALVSGR